jgi:type IV pilus assembly protein PilO
LIGAAAGLAVIVLWYLLLWSPRADAIEEAKGRQQAADSALQELRAEARRLEGLRRNEAATRARIEQLRQAIPDEPSLAQFILDANDAAIRSGIDFLSIAPTPPVAPSAPEAGAAPGASPAEIALSITVNGGYFQVIDFINRLNELTRIIVIDNMNLDTGPVTLLSVQIGARMFVTSVPTDTSTGGAPAGTAPGGTTTTTTVPGAATTTLPGATSTTAPGGVTTTTGAP